MQYWSWGRCDEYANVFLFLVLFIDIYVYKVNSVFHPSKVDQMSTRNFWGLNGEKKIVS